MFGSNWKHYQMALELLKLMIRADVPLSADAVTLFVDNMINDALVVRKVAARCRYTCTVHVLYIRNDLTFSSISRLRCQPSAEFSRRKSDLT